MKKLVFIVLLFTLSVNHLFAQVTTNPDSASIGSIEYYQIKDAASTSTYQWGVYGNGGQIISGNGSSTISIQWDNTQSTNTVWVIETNAGGCTGDMALLTVRLFPKPTASINGGASLCAVNSGTPITIDLTGIPPFTLVYKKNGTTITQDKIASNTLTFPAVPTSESITYELVSITDRLATTNYVTGTATITVLPPLKSLQIIHR
jgi:hypothetical protein